MAAVISVVQDQIPPEVRDNVITLDVIKGFAFFIVHANVPAAVEVGAVSEISQYVPPVAEIPINPADVESVVGVTRSFTASEKPILPGVISARALVACDLMV